MIIILLANNLDISSYTNYYYQSHIFDSELSRTIHQMCGVIRLVFSFEQEAKGLLILNYQEPFTKCVESYG